MSGPMYNTEQLPRKSLLRLVTSTDIALLLRWWHQGGKELSSLASAFLKILPLFALLKGFSNKATKVGEEGEKRKKKVEQRMTYILFKLWLKKFPKITLHNGYQFSSSHH